jgi:hypothetical protein
MGKSSPSPPPAPDYAGLAAQQGAANVEAARTTAKLSNPNIIGPLGGQKVSYGTFDQAGYDKAMQDWQASGGGQPQYDEFGNQVGGSMAPSRAQFMTDADTPTITQYLTPEAQKTLEAQQRVQYALAGLGEQGIGTASRIMGTPFQYRGPDIQTSLSGYGQVQNAPNLEDYGRAGANVQAQGVNYGPGAGQYGMAQAGPGVNEYGLAQGNIGYSQAGTGPTAGMFGLQQGGPSGPQLQNRLDTSQLAAMPVNAGTTAQQAIMSRLQPQLERERSQLETQLANQGLVRGGEAYNTALQQQGQRENDLMTQAALQGLNLDLSARQQGLGEQQALGGFANQAALQQFGAGQQATQAQNAAMQQNFAQAQAAQQMANQAAGQNYQQNLGAAQLANQAVGQNFAQGQAATQAYNQAVQQNMSMGMSAAQAQNAAAQQLYNQQMGIQGLYNAAIGQNQQTALAQMQAQNAAQNQAYNQALQGTQFANTAAQQALQQQLGLYNQPLNQISALMSGSQIQMPQFQGYQGANVQAAPIFQAGQAQNAYNMDVYNAQQASANQGLGGLFGLGGAILGGAAGNPLGFKKALFG